MIKKNGNIPTWTDPAVPPVQLPKLVDAAHKANTKVLISVGGWTGSQTFRKAFIDWNIEQIKTFKTDGVDIDWEYPGREGEGCNNFDKDNDVKNFLVLLKEMRTAFDKSFKTHKELTIAGYVQGFSAESGGSKELTAAIGKELDRVNIMAYDINGAWNPLTGPNAPLKAPKNGMSFNSGIDFWISQGVPASKLTGGLGFYGRSTTATVDMTKTGSLFQKQVQGTPPKGDSDDAPWPNPNCDKAPTGVSGNWKFRKLLTDGVLTTPLTAAKPWVRTWDKKSATPWLFNPKTKAFISYDDPHSIGAKVRSAMKRGISGVMVWELSQDSEEGDLMKAIQKNLK
ncbi:glycoside hydrolase [Parasitella parasitica]|nr:glycoside hydrolase [Parasitella parasitica]